MGVRLPVSCANGPGLTLTPAPAPRPARGAASPSRVGNRVRVASDGARAALGVAGILLVILVPAVLTLRTVEEGIARVQSSDPTPYGYTISLLIYLIPIATLMTWFFRNHPEGHSAALRSGGPSGC